MNFQDRIYQNLYIIYLWLSKVILSLFKFAVHTGQWNYMIDVEVNASDVETFERILSVLNNTSLPIQLGNMTEISDIGITTGEYSKLQ